MSRLVLVAVMLLAVASWMLFDPPAPRDVWSNSALPPAEKTNAPGDGLCIDCHTGSVLNEAGGSVTIGDVPSSYLPTQTYTLTVTVQHPSQHRWGFELVALKDSDNTVAGSFTNTTLLTTTQSSGGKTYISHTTINQGQDGTFTGQTSGVWSFAWTAPAQGTGTVKFYAAGNAANGNGLNSGDKIYTTTAISTEGSMTDVDATTWGKIKKLYR